MKKLFFCIILAATYSFASGQQFTLIKDINPGSGSSNICYLTDIDNTLFFGANNSANGMELWKSDGTPAGTKMVKDLNPGTASSSIGYLTNVNRTLFFVANNGITGTELWKSDGTEAGTVLVKDIRPGGLGSNPSSLVNLNGVLYFAANNGSSGTELWKSDGTDAGTVMVKDINVSGSSYPQSLASFGNNIFFAASNGATGTELWKSDGTSAGTVLVKDIKVGSASGYPSELVAVGSTLFFAASNSAAGTELWKSDGTTAGTVLLKDIWTGAGESFPYSLKEIGGKLFFSADNGSTGIELWKSDGTAAGTVLVKDVWPGQQSGAVGNFSKLINQLIFRGNDGINGDKTWQSDGSASGTKTAEQLVDPGNGTMEAIAETDNNIFASITESSVGLELWAISYSSILPLEWLELKARVSGNDGLLEWTTMNEINMKKFDVEVSYDGNTYNSIGIVKANNTVEKNRYSFTDLNITGKGIVRIYYRIRQEDISGKSKYSRVVVLQLKQTAKLLLYPIPARDAITVSGVFEAKGKMSYEIVDNMGRLITRNKIDVGTGTNSISIATGNLSSGVYYIKITELTQWPMRFVKY